MDYNRFVHGLFESVHYKSVTGILGQVTVTGLWKYMLFTGMVMSCLIQLPKALLQVILQHKTLISKALSSGLVK